MCFHFRQFTEQGDTFFNAEGICQDLDAELFSLNDLLADNDCADGLIGFEPLSILNPDENITGDVGGAVQKSIAENIKSRGN